ncbi:methylmalonyl Co-A mutase-associated GTPase MeaB [Micromonospora sp. WMMD1128]|uniref:methylmalonyl Co-A mutase-associated GTPase MeaB n=1 Tax=unclassified Micromonospora TaxID=2617518 RepID=UPI00248BE88B|nr:MULTISPECIES: methylmalonyl Co-A mutase-associated GTPase MeaB [unclassified Micromonospora]WBB74800.1 methylmalonyl Co-A mutase-associated GTPase MeaB [Micromonospora sp. WMMD1128]WFE31830.1 methylmalonyl Co-A mutase-associated GTPase MeaB [Micromonospora sp. WMMD975]
MSDVNIAATGPVRRSRDVPLLVERARAGDPRAVARLITLVESGDETLPQVAAALAPYSGHAQVVGLTGSPGVGKSTTTNELVRALRARGHRVGVLAIDPSSPFTGGAILGDRVRMQDHATDPGVYIRSMSSRGHLGGLSAATPQAVRVLEGAGCDVVLVETVGVGQAEVEVASLADTTLVLLAPGMGDAIQAVKAGILEIADVFVVNKADRDGVDATVRDIQGMIALGERGPGEWRPQVVRAIAARAEGIDDIAAAIDKHRGWLEQHDELRRRREARAAAEIEAIALGALRARIGSLRDGTQLPTLAAKVAEGALDPYAAADELLAQLGT